MFAPMQYNAALSVLLCGLGLLALSWGRARAAAKLRHAGQSSPRAVRRSSAGASAAISPMSTTAVTPKAVATTANGWVRRYSRSGASPTVNATDVLVKYTYGGDANLDGLLDGADYGLIDNYIQFPGTTGWGNGDFNYDGVIDGADYGILDNAIQLQGPPV